MFCLFTKFRKQNHIENEGHRKRKDKLNRFDVFGKLHEIWRRKGLNNIKLKIMT